ncbi:MAG: MFS transporter [Solirubrobacteraceae bacterium]|nr:MFS transporter [Solirubrobacteraceae bacterium]
MVLDTTVMNVAISQVVADLDTTISTVQAAITMYALVMAAFMLTGSRMGDLWGRRRTLGIGLLIYGLGSGITAITPNVTVLFIGWSFIEGFGAVLVIPALATLVVANYSGAQRALAYGILAGAMGAGAGLGPLIGGFATTELSWRYVFAGEVVVVLFVLLFLRKIGDAPRAERKPTMDFVGAALSAVGLGLAVFGILKTSEWGWIIPSGALEIGGTEITPFGLSVVPFMVVGGLGILWAFFRWESRLVRLGRDPLVDPAVLKIGQLRSGLGMMGTQQTILAGVFFVLPVYLQVVVGLDALETGIRLLPLSLALILASGIGGRLGARIAPRTIVTTGVAILLVGIGVLFATIDPELNGTWFAIAMLLAGAGVGLSLSQVGNVIMSSVGSDEANAASGLQGTSQNLGSSLGTALIGSVLLLGLTYGVETRVATDEQISPAARVEILDAGQTGYDIVSIPQAEKALTDAGLSPQDVDRATELYGEAQLQGLRIALFVAALLAIIALPVARRLPAEPLAPSTAS